MNADRVSIFSKTKDEFATFAKQRIAIIEELLAIGTALSSSRDLNKLLNLILSKSREITFSDAGSVYLLDKQADCSKLIFKVAQNDSIPNLSFAEAILPLTKKSLAGYVALTGESLNIPDAYEIPSSLPYQLEQSFDRAHHYRTRSVLVLPMQNQEGEIIGVLQLINRKAQLEVKLDPHNARQFTQSYSDWEESILKSLASQAAISIERNMLQGSIENLFEGFVHASVQAIEARDPTTSGHSERVADLTVRLTEEVNSIAAGPLRLAYFNPRQVKEIRYAALLHDFGKIGVPEAILTKRKKLYPDNLESVRQRFALVKRTLETECAEKKFRYLLEHPHHRHEAKHDSSCPHCQQFTKLEAELEEAIAQLDRHWELIEQLNEPLAVNKQTFLESTEELAEYLNKISQYTYQDFAGKTQSLLTPEEIGQLMIPRGSLTQQERLAIESHVTQSFEFLHQIPWTKNLQNVPAIAYGHHEKLDGSGYPLGLRGDEIPLQSQMMAIADIYDALTAADRPYKRSLPLDIALKILREEADTNKLNHELVRIFEQRSVFGVLGHSLEA